MKSTNSVFFQVDCQKNQQQKTIAISFGFKNSKIKPNALEILEDLLENLAFHITEREKRTKFFPNNDILISLFTCQIGDCAIIANEIWKSDISTPMLPKTKKENKISKVRILLEASYEKGEKSSHFFRTMEMDDREISIFLHQPYLNPEWINSTLLKNLESKETMTFQAKVSRAKKKTVQKVTSVDQQK